MCIESKGGGWVDGSLAPIMRWKSLQLSQLMNKKRRGLQLFYFHAFTQLDGRISKKTTLQIMSKVLCSIDAGVLEIVPISIFCSIDAGILEIAPITISCCLIFRKYKSNKSADQFKTHKTQCNTTQKYKQQF